MTHLSRRSIVAGAGVLLTMAAPASAQLVTRGRAFDRTVVPPAGRPFALRVPSWTTSVLPNGAQLIVSERHALPLVSFRITWVGGAYQFEPAEKRGLAAIAGAMLSEGTTSHTGDQLSNALQLVGTEVAVGIAGESGSMGFLALKDEFEPTLAILEDMLVNPSFPETALDRLRARTLVALTQAKDQTGAIASNVFGKTIYSVNHPYGRFTTEQSINSITRGDVATFHRAYFQPGRAIITVVGDVDPAHVKRTIERVLAPWPAGGEKPTFSYPAPPPSAATTIYLVDKPGAAQSTFAIGLAGPPRATPDFFALQVMNTILGAMFQSRLNADIREQKGYSYGVGSEFSFGKGPGPFRAGGDIVTDKSDSALVEFMKQLRGIRGDQPVTDEELATAKAALVQRLPEAFASVSSVSGTLTNLYVQNLSTDYYQHYAAAVNAITKDDLARVARQYVDLGHLVIVVVGDRKAIEWPLRATGIAPLVILDVNGNPAS